MHVDAHRDNVRMIYPLYVDRLRARLNLCTRDARMSVECLSLLKNWLTGNLLAVTVLLSYVCQCVNYDTIQ